MYSTKYKLHDGTYIVPADKWPVFMWKDKSYNPDKPWKGLLQSQLLVKVSDRHVSFPTESN